MKFDAMDSVEETNNVGARDPTLLVLTAWYGRR